MKTELSSGNYNIFSSGEAFLFDKSSDLTVKLSEGSVYIALKIVFVKDDSGEQGVETKIQGDTLLVSCINFSRETGLTEPMRIGEFDGQYFYLMLWSYVDGSKEHEIRRVKYTVFSTQK